MLSHCFQGKKKYFWANVTFFFNCQRMPAIFWESFYSPPWLSLAGRILSHRLGREPEPPKQILPGRSTVSMLQHDAGCSVCYILKMFGKWNIWPQPFAFFLSSISVSDMEPFWSYLPKKEMLLVVRADFSSPFLKFSFCSPPLPPLVLCNSLLCHVLSFHRTSMKQEMYPSTICNTISPKD